MRSGLGCPWFRRFDSGFSGLGFRGYLDLLLFSGVECGGYLAGRVDRRGRAEEGRVGQRDRARLVRRWGF